MLVLLLAGMIACGPRDVDLTDDWMVGVFSSMRTNEPATWLLQFEIRDDGTAIRRLLDACGDYEVEETYAWKVDGDDAILISDPSGDTIDNARELRVSRTDDCERLVVEHLFDVESEYKYAIYRGAVCLEPGVSVCLSVWCDAGASDAAACTQP
jgi:hypothetical protein